MSTTLLKLAADFVTQLSTQVAIGDTTATLSSVLDDDAVTLPTGLYGLTIDSGQSNKEYIVCTLTSTALTGITSITRQGVATSGFARTHRAGAKVTITDWAILSRILNNLNGTTGFDSATNLGYDGTPTGLTGNQFATVNYVLSVVSGGTVTFDQQIISNQSSGEALAINDVVYFKESDQKWYKADADLTATFDQLQLGINKTTASAANETIQVAISGPVSGFTGLTAGSKYYLSNTAGAITTSAGTNSVFLGWALSTTSFLFNPVLKTLPSQKEKDAMAGGSTFGTPSTTNKFITEDKIKNYIGKFGGTGADGALTISSGATNINLGGAAVIIKNYTSISITGTGSLTFTNPNASGTIIILKSQGDVTVTSSTVPAIDTRGMGAPGGTPGNDGSDPVGLVINTNRPRGQVGATTVGGAAGSAVNFPNFYTISANSIYTKQIRLLPGAGGGGGQNNNSSTGGTGGAGGGALYIECNGALNFTGTINCSGNNGTNSTNATSTDDAGGAGGGGAAGTTLILYNTLTTNSGTITASGGTGGNSGTSAGTSGSNNGGGGGAGSIVAAGGAGGSTDTNGFTAAGLGAGGGGAGGKNGAGVGLTGGTGGGSMGGIVTINTEFF